MEWTDDAIVLGVRKHGETSVVAELMTRERGRHLGLVQGGRSRTMRPTLQPGNSVKAVWRARLDEHLGQFKIEPGKLRAAELMENSHGIYALQTLVTLVRLLPERDAHPDLFATLQIILDHLSSPEIAGELVVRFELAMLDELGFGLDFSSCAATGATQDLVYVSPKSGKAVSRSGGHDYRDRLLPLPSFLLRDNYSRSETVTVEEILDGFSLTGYFLNRHVYGPRALQSPSERAGLIRAIDKSS